MLVISNKRFTWTAIVAGVSILSVLLASSFLRDSESFATVDIGRIKGGSAHVMVVESLADSSIKNINYTSNELSKSADNHNELELLVFEYIETLKAEIGKNIKSIALQISLIELRNDLVAAYPSQGKILFERIIRKAFPELAEAILLAIATMDIYEQWLLETMPDLNKMDLIEQEKILWRKRFELFGEVAGEIWEEEWTPEKEREESVHKTLELLDTAYGTPMDERLYLLQSAFEESYGNTIEGFVFDSKSVMSQAFLNFDSVQKDLSNMSQEDRQIDIAQIRRTLGYPENRIELLGERDLKKEQDWKNGYAYMKARSQAEKKFSGEALEAEFDKLREVHFTYRAPTIKREEGADFYRYTRPRVYGQN
jgi:hypothetical protein